MEEVMLELMGLVLAQYSAGSVVAAVGPPFFKVISISALHCHDDEPEC
jgi:hypothetical protein